METSVQTTVTRLLLAVGKGNQDAVNVLFPLIYNDLHARAQQQRQFWNGNYTINTTALVHEAYIKLVDREDAQWNSRAHFLAVAAKAMRHILIDYARQCQRKKRGGGVPRLSLDDLSGGLADTGLFQAVDDRADVLVALDDVLRRLGSEKERQGRVVECRFFGGMTIPDTAAALGISPATVKRDWVMAQAWLYRELQQMAEE